MFVSTQEKNKDDHDNKDNSVSNSKSYLRNSLPTSSQKGFLPQQILLNGFEVVSELRSAARSLLKS